MALADGVDSQYAKFEDWREKADNTNDKLVGFENRVKNEGKIGDEIPFVKLQLADNEVKLWSCGTVIERAYLSRPANSSHSHLKWHSCSVEII